MRNMLKNMLLAALPVVFLAGCVDYGKVDLLERRSCEVKELSAGNTPVTDDG